MIYLLFCDLETKIITFNCLLIINLTSHEVVHISVDQYSDSL